MNSYKKQRSFLVKEKVAKLGRPTSIVLICLLFPLSCGFSLIELIAAISIEFDVLLRANLTVFSFFNDKL